MTDILDHAAKFIKIGNVVAFPTETVYGLGADASNERACQKIFKIKKRPNINPLIVHVGSMSQAKTIGEFNTDALKLSDVFWPGPLSIVVPLKRGANIAKSVLAGLTTVALRIPSHNIALELIRNSGTPIAAPSANPSGYISATALKHVKEHFSDEKDVFILAYRKEQYIQIEVQTPLHELNSIDYQCQYGIESTIIDSTANNLAILRDGFITKEALEKVVGKTIEQTSRWMQIKAPGMMNRHYSPKVQIRLNVKSLESNELGLNFANSELKSNLSFNLSLMGDLIEAASNLYTKLRILDNYAKLNRLTIAVAPIPEVGIGVAINDRLKRAAIK